MNVSERQLRAADQAGTAAASDWRTYKRLLRYVRPYWALFLLAVLGFLCS